MDMARRSQRINGSGALSRRGVSRTRMPVGRIHVTTGVASYAATCDCLGDTILPDRDPTQGCLPEHNEEP